LATGDIADDMSTGSHVAFVRGARLDIDNVVEEVGLAMLTTEILNLVLAATVF
jgi:hypothetical protein